MCIASQYLSASLLVVGITSCWGQTLAARISLRLVDGLCNQLEEFNLTSEIPPALDKPENGTKARNLNGEVKWKKCGATSACSPFRLYLYAMSGSASEEGGKEGEEPYFDPEQGPYLEGDLLGNPYEDEDSRNGIIPERYRWTKGYVSYYIAKNFTSEEADTIRHGILDLAWHTCIQFYELSNQNEATGNYLYYVKHDKWCSSYIGMRGIGAQVVNLARTCFWVKTGVWGTGILVHETLHALGFFHEHSRLDRDPYVKIYLQKVPEEKRRNFEKQNSNPYTYHYDYGSIMHYKKDEFATKPGDTVIETLKPNAPVIGQRLHVSNFDVGKVNAMYREECNARVPYPRASIAKLFKAYDCQGEFLEITSMLRELPSEWENAAKSVDFVGAWLFYENPDYNTGGRGVMEYMFNPYWKCNRFEHLEGNVSSVRWAGNASDYQSSTLTLYGSTNFAGLGTFYLTDNISNLPDYADQRSLILTGVYPWMLYNQPNYTGETRCISPADQYDYPYFLSDYNKDGIWYAFARSVARGCIES